MPLDPYAPCPCGSGKRFKWCCQPIHVQIDKAFQLDADGQHDAALKAIYLAMCHDVGPQAYVRQQKAIMGRADSRPLLPTIRCPTLVLVGAQDEATPPALSDEMAAAIPDARLVTVPDCGHLSTLEQPEAVTRALAEWMSS